MEIDGARELNQALHAAKRKKEASVWFSTWPNIKEVTLRFAEYVTNGINDAESGKPLLTLCVTEAFSAITSEWTDRKNETQFLAALFRHAPRLFKVRVGVMATNEFIPWDPLFEPLGFFLSRNHGELTVLDEPFCEISDDQARLLFAVRLMSVRDISRIGIKNVIG